jgi:hypothetical protein
VVVVEPVAAIVVAAQMFVRFGDLTFALKA